MVLGYECAIGKKAGFTLIELLVVLTIVGLLIGLVGPLTINSLNRAEARAERLKFINWLRFLSHEAYLTATPVDVEFNGKSLQIHRPETPVINQTFEYLFFPPQVMRVNQNGFVEPLSLSVSFQGNNQTINLESINALGDG